MLPAQCLLTFPLSPFFLASKAWLPAVGDEGGDPELTHSVSFPAKAFNTVKSSPSTLAQTHWTSLLLLLHVGTRPPHPPTPMLPSSFLPYPRGQKMQ